jgi:hypothetical protein
LSFWEAQFFRGKGRHFFHTKGTRKEGTQRGFFFVKLGALLFFVLKKNFSRRGERGRHFFAPREEGKKGCAERIRLCETSALLFLVLKKRFPEGKKGKALFRTKGRRKEGTQEVFLIVLFAA